GAHLRLGVGRLAVGASVDHRHHLWNRRKELPPVAGAGIGVELQCHLLAHGEDRLAARLGDLDSGRRSGRRRWRTAGASQRADDDRPCPSVHAAEYRESPAARSEVPSMASLPKTKVVEILNKILEIELAGVVRYTHYSLMVFGHARIPIVSW